MVQGAVLKPEKKRLGIIVGASSDIGLAIAQDWLNKGISVIGSYRTRYAILDNLADRFEALLPCDFADLPSIVRFGDSLLRKELHWDYLIICPGTIKAVELIDAEMPDLRITIIGPGWVHTKIHDETLRSEISAPGAFAETSRRLAESDFKPLSHVIDCVAWAMEAPKEVVSGRNFSVVHDSWGSDTLSQQLREDPNMYKLRRAGNQ